MDDSLEKLIKKQRDLLDSEPTPPEVWQDIKKSVFHKKKSNWFWKVAAGILLMISVSLTVLLYQKEQIVSHYQDMGLEKIDPSYKKLERQYQKDIQQLASQIDFSVLKNNGFSWLLEELDNIDKINKQFRDDLERTGNRERLLEILIDQYEKKLKILKRIELEINRIENEEKQENPGIVS